MDGVKIASFRLFTMSLPGNGVFVVRGELAALGAAMRRGARWSSHQEEDPEGPARSLRELRAVLDGAEDLRAVEPSVYLGPFLEIIRSEETTGPVTSLALSAVNKFLSYGLIGEERTSVGSDSNNVTVDFMTILHFPKVMRNVNSKESTFHSLSTSF